jgi:hypothetical protein
VVLDGGRRLATETSEVMWAAARAGAAVSFAALWEHEDYEEHEEHDEREEHEAVRPAP